MFENVKDEELIIRTRSGDVYAEEVLLQRCSSYVKSIARKFFLAGADSEDLIQEGMIGVMKAIAEFDEERDASFKTFSSLCVRNRIYSAIRASRREKNLPLNNYVSMEAGNDADGARVAVDTAPDPVEQLIGEESYRELLEAVSALLSKLERQVLEMYLSGMSYTEIAKEVSKPQKSIDNAVQRIRRKFAQHLKNSGDIRR